MSPAAAALQVKTGTVNGRPVVTVRGDVDLRTSPQLRILLLEAARKIAGPLVLDLSGVTYMDSSGVGTLVFIKRETEHRGRPLVLLGLQPRVRSVLEITHLDRFFKIVQKLDEVVWA